MEACREHEEKLIYLIVLVAVSTGMRQGEILNLKWRDLDFDQSLALVNDSKNQERRSVHLVGDAKKELRDLAARPHGEDDYVFPNRRGTGPVHTRKAWEEVIQAAEIEDFRFHDLRHTFASYLAMSGATLVEIAEALGHKTLEMVRKYAHLAEGHTREVVARMNRQFLG